MKGNLCELHLNIIEVIIKLALKKNPLFCFNIQCDQQTTPPCQHTRKPHLHPPTPCLPRDPSERLVRALHCQKAGSHSCARPPFSMCESESVCLCLYLRADLGQCVRACVRFSLYMSVFVSQPVYLASMTLLSIPTSSVQKFPVPLNETLAYTA